MVFALQRTYILVKNTNTQIIKGSWSRGVLHGWSMGLSSLKVETGVKVCVGEEVRVFRYYSNPLTWWVLESLPRFGTGLQTKWLLNADQQKGSKFQVLVLSVRFFFFYRITELFKNAT